MPRGALKRPSKPTGSLPGDHGLYGMGRDAEGNRLRLPHIEFIVDRLVALVHHHAHHALVFIHKSGAQQVAAAADRADPFGSRANEFGEVADVIIGGGID